MISNLTDHAVKPFILHFAERLPPTSPAQAAMDDESGRPSVTCRETRFTKVTAETTDDT